MPIHSTVHVQLSERSYDIHIGSGLLGEASTWVRDWCQPTHVVVFTDGHVGELHAEPLVESLRAADLRVDLITLSPGEATKSIEQCSALWRRLLTIGADRKSVVVAVGGGVVGDLAGFIAATYARGLSFIQAPTSLLAQVDSSVGGKVGVNLPDAKNMVGAFWQPHGVLIDIDVLQTLPERDYRAGLGEVVKYGVILDEEFFAYLEANVSAINNRDPHVLAPIIARCCRLKADVVEADERELTGQRAVLNYGHTFCHAIEAVAGYGAFEHGEAVAVGMLCASRLAEALGRVSADVTQRQQRLLEQLQLPTEIGDLVVDDLLNAMQRDKKVEHGKLRFVLPTRLGHVELVPNVDASLVRDAWRPA